MKYFVCLTNLNLNTINRLPNNSNIICSGKWVNYNLISQNLFHIDHLPSNEEEALRLHSELNFLLDNFLTILIEQLNNIFPKKLSKRFWEIVLTPYYLHLSTVVHHKLKTIDSIKLKYPKEKIAVEIFETGTNSPTLTPFDLPDLFNFINTDWFNHYIFSYLIERDVFFQDKTYINIETPTTVTKQKKNHLKDGIKDLISSFGDTYLGSVYGLKLREKLFLFNLKDYLFSDNIFQHGKWGAIVSDFKKIETEKFSNSTFDQILFHLFPTFANNRIPRQPFLKRKKIWIGNDVYSDGVNSFYIARIVENGGKWISVQHGGCYGHLKIFPLGEIEFKLSDAFFTWGWSSYGPYPKCNFIPNISLFLADYSERKKSSNRSIVFISTEVPRYIYRYHSSLLTQHVYDYKSSQYSFLKQLNHEVLKDLSYKPYPNEYVTNERLKSFLLENNIPSIENTKTHEIYQNSRLVIIDHCATTMLESLAVNVPTVLIISSDSCQLDNEALPYFEILKKCNIFFDNFNLAADFINSTKCVDDWWYSNTTQNAVNIFVAQFAKKGKKSDFWKSFKHVKKQLLFNNNTDI